MLLEFSMFFFTSLRYRRKKSRCQKNNLNFLGWLPQARPSQTSATSCGIVQSTSTSSRDFWKKAFLIQSCCRWWFPTSPNKSGNYAQLVPTSRLGSALFPYTILLVSHRPLLTTNHPPFKNKILQADLPSKTSEPTSVKTLPLENSSFF